MATEKSFAVVDIEPVGSVVKDEDDKSDQIVQENGDEKKCGVNNGDSITSSSELQKKIIRLVEVLTLHHKLHPEQDYLTPMFLIDCSTILDMTIWLMEAT